MSNGFETYDEDYANDDEVGDDETEIDEETRCDDETFEAPRVDEQAIGSNVKNDLTQDLGKDSFKDKEELIKAIKLYSIRKNKQYEVVETCLTIWKIRRRLSSQCGCKWKLRACKRKRSGYFEITQYTGPHTCLHNKITQDHPNLDACKRKRSGYFEITQYTWPHTCSHVLSACAFLSLNSSQYVQRYYSITNYSATWASEFSPLPHEAYWPTLSITLLPNYDLKRKGRGRPRSTRLRNGMDIKEGKKENKCGFCKQSGHN
ncbi:DNA-binding WRKY transcription factor [Tanacetum coccineum]|uniref:DNA-binding WRKY transcription factor n=1 Tax=Tanacetum coccineum TaxID=301880 RepID=A0ABQ5C4F5_9ASTR